MNVSHNCFPLEYQEHVNYFLRSNINPYNNCLDIKFKKGEHDKVVCRIKSKSLNADYKDIEKKRKEQKEIFSGLIDSLNGQFKFLSNPHSEILNSKIHALFQIAMEKIVGMIFLFQIDEQESRKALAKSLQVHLYYNFKEQEVKSKGFSIQLNQNLDVKAAGRSTLSVEDIKKPETPTRSRFSSDEKQKGRKLFELSPRKHEKLNEPSENVSKSRRKTSSPDYESIEKDLENLDDTGLQVCRLYWNLKSKYPQHLNEELEKSDTMQSYKKSNLEGYVKIEKSFVNHPNMNYLIQLQCSRILKGFPNLSTLAQDVNRHIQDLAVESLGKTILEPISKRVLDAIPRGFLPEDLKQSLMLATIRVKVERCEILLRFLLAQLSQMESYVSKISYNVSTADMLSKEISQESGEIMEVWQNIVLSELRTPTNETCASILESFLNYLLKVDGKKKEVICKNRMKISDQKEAETPSSLIKTKLAMLFLTLSQENYSLPTKSVLESMPIGLTEIKKEGHSIRLQFFESGRIKVLAEGTISSTEKIEPAKFEITVHNILNGFLDQLPSWSSNVSIEIRNLCLLKKPVSPFVYNFLNQVGFRYNLNTVQKKEL